MDLFAVKGGISSMPRQWVSRYGLEQTRREGTALYPPELVVCGHRFTLEMDGMHAALATDQGIVHLVLEPGCVASFLEWLQSQEAWREAACDPEYAIETATTDCSYCYRNLTHTREQHQQALDQVSEQRKLLERSYVHRQLEFA